MAKRAFRKQVEPQHEQASYPTLEAVDGDRRFFLKRLGLGILGAGAIGGLMGCGDRAVGEKEPESDWQLSGAPDSSPPTPPPDMGIAPQPDLEPDWQLSGARLEPDTGPTPPPADMGIAPQPDLEPDWQLSGMPDSGPPPPIRDAGTPPDAGPSKTDS